MTPSARRSLRISPDPPRARLDHVPRLLPAACLHLSEGLRLTALPRDRTGWASLCRMLSVGRLRAQKGNCILHIDDLLAHSGGLELLLHAPDAVTRDLAPRRDSPDTGARSADQPFDGALL